MAMKTYAVRVKRLHLVDYYVVADSAEEAEDKVAASVNEDEDFDHKTIDSEFEFVATKELRT